MWLKVRLSRSCLGCSLDGRQGGCALQAFGGGFREEGAQKIDPDMLQSLLLIGAPKTGCLFDGNPHPNKRTRLLPCHLHANK